MKTILFRGLQLGSLLLMLDVAASGGRAAGAGTGLPAGVRDGAVVDVAPWGERASWENGRDVGLWWEDPRDLWQVVVTFAGDLPQPKTARLQWWQSQWPDRRVPRDRPMGAGESGWHHLGDLYQGQWRDADVQLQAEGRVWSFRFRPLNAKEYPRLRDFAAPWRTTLRVRVLFDGPAPEVKSLQAVTDSVWRSVELGVEWGGQARDREVWDGTFDVFNGYAAAPSVLAPGLPVTLAGDGRWVSVVQGGVAGVRTRVWFAKSPNANTFDDTVVTLQAGERSFSFAPAEVAAGRRVYVPSLGVVVCPASEVKAVYEAPPAGGTARGSLNGQAVAAVRGLTNEALYTKVFSEPEQSLARAEAEQPPKRSFYIPLGTAGGRQRFGVNPDGSAFCVNDRIDEPKGKDTGRLKWGGYRLTWDFGLPAVPPMRRWLEQDSLPIIHAEWEQGGIRYTETALVTRLDPGGLGFPDMRADDSAVLLVRLTGRNLATEYRTAAVGLSARVDDRPLDLALRDGRVVARTPDGEVLRGLADIQSSAITAQTNGQIRFSGHMPPGTDGCLVLKLPFVSLDAPGEVQRLQDMDFEEELQRVRQFWQGRADAGAQITTPIPELNHFYRAHVSHLLINCGREVGADRLMARVGSFGYGVYGNESCMMITDLDRRGFHAEAERCLETFLHYQGTSPLPGDYESQAGVFNGAGSWESGGYNQHHGWILWAMAEHYRYSGDRAWLLRNADRLVTACRWIVRERARTRDLDGLRRVERGLLPAGSLEDIGDWRVWMSNNVFSWWGLAAVAQVLTEVGHPEGGKLLAEAEAYRQDILARFREASVRSPVVPLRDGTWVPQIPSEVHRRGRTFGWITTTLEGSIYLLRTGLLASDDPLAVAILKDYEDNLYLSERYGYSWEKHGAQWFSRGGISMQPNLLCSPHPYLLRDEIPHFLRAYFNAFAACYYRDTRMMTEHPLPDLGDWRGDHYKSSDEANSTYWLRLMFIAEEGDNLFLGKAIPRAWLAEGASPSIENAATYFGPMNLRFESQAARGRLTAVVDPPTRRLPSRLYLRFRHPEGKRMTRVEVDDKAWAKFDATREWVELPAQAGSRRVVAFYE